MRKLLQGFLLVTLVACQGENRDIIRGTVLSIDGPTEVRVGQAYELMINFSGGNDGCAQANHLESERDGDTIYVDAYYDYPREKVPCTMVVPMHSLPMSVRFEEAGVYTITSRNTDVVYEVTAVP